MGERKRVRKKEGGRKERRGWEKEGRKDRRKNGDWSEGTRKERTKGGRFPTLTVSFPQRNSVGI